MKTIPFKDKESWLLARNGRITGTRLKDIIVKRGTEKKIGFYELIAERLSVQNGVEELPNETPMDRGTRLQATAIEKFAKKTKKKVNSDLVMWTREDNDMIAVSPDGTISDTEAIEVKCLSSARHIEALITNKVPNEYEMQAMQYFIVNDKLEKLYLAFYDPRIPCKEFFYLTVKRADIQEKVEEYLAYQIKELEEVNAIVAKLTKF